MRGLGSNWEISRTLLNNRKNNKDINGNAGFFLYFLLFNITYEKYHIEHSHEKRLLFSLSKANRLNGIPKTRTTINIISKLKSVTKSVNTHYFTRNLMHIVVRSKIQKSSVYVISAMLKLIK